MNEPTLIGGTELNAAVLECASTHGACQSIRPWIAKHLYCSIVTCICTLLAHWLYFYFYDHSQATLQDHTLLSPLQFQEESIYRRKRKSPRTWNWKMKFVIRVLGAVLSSLAFNAADCGSGMRLTRDWPDVSDDKLNSAFSTLYVSLRLETAALIFACRTESSPQ